MIIPLYTEHLSLDSAGVGDVVSLFPWLPMVMIKNALESFILSMHSYHNLKKEIL